MKGYVKIEVKNLVFADWNYKQENPEMMEKLKNNIKRNGQIENIIVRELDNEKYEVINGNHRLEVLTGLNHEYVICYNLGKISDNDARRIAIETNETKFDSDKEKLVVLINSLLEDSTLDSLENTLPYTSDELQNIKDLKDFNWSEFDQHRKDKYGDKDLEGEEEEKNDTTKISMQIQLDMEGRKLWFDWKEKMKATKDSEAFTNMISQILQEKKVVDKC